MKKYQNKYRIDSARANWKDYGDVGTYFITINTLDFKHYFGKIENGIMCLNDIGTIAYNEWLHTLSLRPDMNLTLHAHIIMPNHMHALITIGKNKYNQKKSLLEYGIRPEYRDGNFGDDLGIENDLIHGNFGDDLGIENDPIQGNFGDDLGTDALQCVSPNANANANPESEFHIEWQNPNNIHPQRRITIPGKFGPQHKNLSSIIRGYKGTITKQARMINPNFTWQARFHDRIAKDTFAIPIITRYIHNNPKNYKKK